MSSEELECSICLDGFTDPRLLICGHSFCKSCLESCYSKATRSALECPECREITPLPTGIEKLPVNWAVQKALNSSSVAPPARERVASPAASAQCEAHRALAILFCKQCRLLLCATCIPDHAIHPASLGPVSESVPIFAEAVKETSAQVSHRLQENVIQRRQLTEMREQAQILLNDQEHRVNVHFERSIAELRSRQQELLEGLANRGQEVDSQLVEEIKSLENLHAQFTRLSESLVQLAASGTEYAAPTHWSALQESQKRLTESTAAKRKSANDLLASVYLPSFEPRNLESSVVSLSREFSQLSPINVSFSALRDQFRDSSNIASSSSPIPAPANDLILSSPIVASNRPDNAIEAQSASPPENRINPPPNSHQRGVSPSKRVGMNASHVSPAVAKKPICMYGDNCFRRNPQHFLEYSHPESHPMSKERYSNGLASAVLAPMAIEDDSSPKMSRAAPPIIAPPPGSSLLQTQREQASSSNAVVAAPSQLIQSGKPVSRELDISSPYYGLVNIWKQTIGWEQYELDVTGLFGTLGQMTLTQVAAVKTGLPDPKCVVAAAQNPRLKSMMAYVTDAGQLVNYDMRSKRVVSTRQIAKITSSDCSLFVVDNPATFDDPAFVLVNPFGVPTLAHSYTKLGMAEIPTEAAICKSAICCESLFLGTAAGTIYAKELFAKESVWMWQAHLMAVTGMVAIPKFGQPAADYAYASEGMVVTSSYDRTLIAWNATTREKIWQVEIPTQPITELAFTIADGAPLIACAHQDGEISIYNHAGTKIRSWTAHGRPISTIAITPKYVISSAGAHDPRLHVWDWDRQIRVAYLSTHGYGVFKLQLFAGNTACASISQDGMVCFWHLGSDVATHPLEIPALQHKLPASPSRRMPSAFCLWLHIDES